MASNNNRTPPQQGHTPIRSNPSSRFTPPPRPSVQHTRGMQPGAGAQGQRMARQPAGNGVANATNGVDGVEKQDPVLRKMRKHPAFDFEAERRVPCNKKLACGHRCADPAAYKIWPCSMCTVPVTIIRECGHTASFFCGRGAPYANCVKDCGKIFLCGHPCTRTCSDPLCGIGTCGGYRCVSDYPELHNEFVAAYELVLSDTSPDDDWSDKPQTDQSNQSSKPNTDVFWASLTLDYFKNKEQKTNAKGDEVDGEKPQPKVEDDELDVLSAALKVMNENAGSIASRDGDGSGQPEADKPMTAAGDAVTDAE